MPLGADEVRIWCIDLSGGVTDAVSLLSQDERERLARYRFETHRRRFAVRRAALRTILGDLLEVDPRAVAFRYTQHGKPEVQSLGLRRPEPRSLELESPELQSPELRFPDLQSPEAEPTEQEGPRLRFNLSDSEDFAIVGVTWDAAIGVDVERIKPVAERDAIARRHFSAREYEAYARVPGEDRDRAFYNCWTRKEAWLKARGEGLIGDLQAFSVSLGPAARLLEVAGEEAAPKRWRLHSHWLEGGYVAAVAVERERSRFVWTQVR